ncbi:unnamed protein product [Cylicostephanus goldi]|uniref:PARP1-like PADR1 domain-containing protein n=1 Tax=Cylicostephanus goldi TaxID=71465 RepID=A0A3P6UEA2_CYLGO|nr:unnamed protein product [Cylicostephanus goldi]
MFANLPLCSSTTRNYRCDGHISEYTKCTHQDLNPQRKPFVVPKDVKKKNDHLKYLRMNFLKERVYNEAIADEKVVGHSDQFKYLGSRGMKTSEVKAEVEGKSLGVGSGMSQQLVKAGTIVDQECEYSDVSHVHRARNGNFCGPGEFYIRWFWAVLMLCLTGTRIINFSF